MTSGGFFFNGINKGIQKLAQKLHSVCTEESQTAVMPALL